MRGLLILTDANSQNLSKDGYLLMEDGGVATFHHNGEHMITTLYQDRMCEGSAHCDDIWTLLGEGKTYATDHEGKNEIDEVMVAEAMNWLSPSELCEYSIAHEDEKLTAGQQYSLFLECCFNEDFDEHMN